MIRTVHLLKTWPKYFQAVWDRDKTFEARVNDRDYQVGDELWIREYNPEEGEYSGRAIHTTITYILYLNARGFMGKMRTQQVAILSLDTTTNYIDRSFP